ncbi:MAG TPA: class I SAM-dependent methyltransferase [Dehalococcoidia bacterium]|nr:class I SAM-dependent methyltransferase [Dehalococcoidia bacterium]
MTAQQLDQAKVEAFAGQMLGALNGASLALMTSIGHQTGLFEAMATLPPSTSEQIARAAGLQERYVREWLGAMVAGHIVTCDAAGKTFTLPPEHAVCLTKAAGPNNLANFAQFIPALGTVEQKIITSFRNGGGVPYSEYANFQGLMAQMSGPTVDATLLQTTLPLVPGLVQKLRDGIDVADVGCGSGHAINTMAQAFPQSRFTGFDFSEDGIAAGTAEAAKLGLTNARFVLQDAATLDTPAQFDLVTVFDAIHDQAQPRKVLRNIASALRPGGAYLMVDVRASSNIAENAEHPLAPFLYTVSCMHCMTVSLALNGEGLGAAWGEQKALELLAEAGFRDVDVKQVEGDIVNNYYICRAGG